MIGKARYREKLLAAKAEQQKESFRELLNTERVNQMLVCVCV